MSMQIKNAPSTAMDEAQIKIRVNPSIPLTCSHCDIPIDFRFDTDHTVEVDGEDVTVCDSCYGDWYIHGDDFGDSYRGRCMHREFAGLEMDSRKVAQTA